MLARRRGRHVTGHRPRVEEGSRPPLGFIDERMRLAFSALGEDILGTTRQAAAADFLLARLTAAFLGAAFTPTLRPRPSDFAKSDRCAA